MLTFKSSGGLGWTSITLTSCMIKCNQYWSLRAISARSSNKLIGWCWKQLFYMSRVPCKNEKKHQQLQNFKLCMGVERMAKSSFHGWTGNASSVEAIFPRFGSSEPPWGHSDGGGWMVKWKKLLSTWKKVVFQWRQWHPWVISNAAWILRCSSISWGNRP